MKTEHAGYVSWTRTIVAMSLLLFGSYPALGQAPASNATGRRKAQASATVPATDSRRLPADVAQAIRWLPEDTETIILARGRSRMAYSEISGILLRLQRAASWLRRLLVQTLLQRLVPRRSRPFRFKSRNTISSKRRWPVPFIFGYLGCQERHSSRTSPSIDSASWSLARGTSACR